MNALVIVCENQNEKNAATSICASFGYSYVGGGDVHQYIKENHKEINDTMYPNLVVRKTHSKSFDFTNKGKDNYFPSGFDYLSMSSDLPKILEFLTSVNSVKISNDYDAVVSKNGITVGCQTIKFEDFDKLAELVKKFR